jgi:hypothetical protein
MTTLRFLKLLAFTLVLGTALVPSATLVSADAATVEVNADGSVQSEEANSSPPSGSSSKTMQGDKPKIDPNCPDRDHLMRCARVHLDTNKNGKLDRDELEKAISSLPWYVQ